MSEPHLIDLNDFRSNTYSQGGEDGILQKLFSTLGISNGQFCEFGAWDGRHLSNTYNLYLSGWGGWYIEGDPARFEDLKRNISREDIRTLLAFVTPDGANTLDTLLAEDGKPPKVDLLSIDIDSDDLAIWKSVKTFRPRVVVIEFNPTIPIDVFFENPRGENKGNSARSIFEFAKSAEYHLVAVSRCNLIFYDARSGFQPFKTYDIADPSLRLGQRLFFGFDGTLVLATSGPMNAASTPEFFQVPWHPTAIFPQPLPRQLRRYREGGFMPRLTSLVCGFRTTIATPLYSTRRLLAKYAPSYVHHWRRRCRKT